MAAGKQNITLKIGGKDYSRLCTYVELNARRENTGQGYSGDVMYRFYLGDDDVSDFSVTGNCMYDIILDLTEEGLHLDSWKVTRGDDWQDTRVLSFLNDPYVVYRGGTCNVGYKRLKCVILILCIHFCNRILFKVPYQQFTHLGNS